jgi:hypothetical protein
MQYSARRAEAPRLVVRRGGLAAAKSPLAARARPAVGGAAGGAAGAEGAGGAEGGEGAGAGAYGARRAGEEGEGEGGTGGTGGTGGAGGASGASGAGREPREGGAGREPREGGSEASKGARRLGRAGPVRAGQRTDVLGVLSAQPAGALAATSTAARAAGLQRAVATEYASALDAEPMERRQGRPWASDLCEAWLEGSLRSCDASLCEPHLAPGSSSIGSGDSGENNNVEEEEGAEADKDEGHSDDAGVRVAPGPRPRPLQHPQRTQHQALCKAGLDRASLSRLGLGRAEADRVYRAMYVYSFGFHQCASELCRSVSVPGGSKSTAELLGCVWRVYSSLVEQSGPLMTSGLERLEGEHRATLARVRGAREEELRGVQAAQAGAERACEAARAEQALALSELAASRGACGALEQRVRELEEALSERDRALCTERLRVERGAALQAKLDAQMREDTVSQCKAVSAAVSAREELSRREQELREARLALGESSREQGALSQQLAQVQAARFEADEALCARALDVARLEEMGLGNQQEVASLRQQCAALEQRVRELSDEARFSRADVTRARRALEEASRVAQALELRLAQEQHEAARARREAEAAQARAGQFEAAQAGLVAERQVAGERYAALAAELQRAHRAGRAVGEAKSAQDAELAAARAQLDELLRQSSAEGAMRQRLQDAVKFRSSELAGMEEQLGRHKRVAAERTREAAALKEQLAQHEAAAAARAGEAAERECELAARAAELEARAARAEGDVAQERSAMAALRARCARAEDELQRASDRALALADKLGDLPRVERELARLRGLVEVAAQDAQSVDEDLEAFCADLAAACATVAPAGAAKAAQLEKAALEEAALSGFLPGKKRPPPSACLRLRARRGLVKDMEQAFATVLASAAASAAQRASSLAAAAKQPPSRGAEEAEQLQLKLQHELAGKAKEVASLGARVAELHAALEAEAAPLRDALAAADERDRAAAHRIALADKLVQSQAADIQALGAAMAGATAERDRLTAALDELTERLGGEIETVSALRAANHALEMYVKQQQQQQKQQQQQPRGPTVAGTTPAPNVS